MSRFYELEPTSENYWRAIILFGRNVASYKFALAKSLFDLRGSSNDLILLEDLAPLFAKHLTDHLKLCDKQTTSGSSKFLDICKSFNDGKIDVAELAEWTKKLGFANVIDAFHNVHGDEVGARFFYDERKSSGGIRLSEVFYQIAETSGFHDLNIETEARWRLVETAWELGVSRNVVQVNYDEDSGLLHAFSHALKRVDITSSRAALNGYQKGKCFYCFRDISVDSGADDLADVDHFFPHKLKYCADGKPVDGVANLVLACKDCNRGTDGKFDRIPHINFLDRLHQRNEYLITSHHPLRETLKLQTGITAADRTVFLQDAYNCAKITVPATTWRPEPQAAAVF